MPIDLLINNAGIYEGGGIEATTKADLMHQYEVNTVGPFLTTSLLLPNLKLAVKENGSAMVVQVTSSMGSIMLNSSSGLPDDTSFTGGSYGYRMSKSALNMLTKNLSVDLETDAITCIALHPGYVATDGTHHSGPVSQVDSIAGMAKVIANATHADSGKFFDFEGNLMPW